MKRSFDERTELEICTRYRGGETSIALGKEYNVSKTTILKLLGKHGVRRRTVPEAARLRNSDKHNIVIPSIDSLLEIDKYWLGFILGDGCVYYPKINNHSKIFSIALKTSDVFHLERLKKYFNSNKKIVTQGKGTSCIQIASNELVKYLEHFSIHQRKSGKEKAHPKLLNSRDFWRGLIDADGSIYRSGDCTRLSLSGSKTLCQQFRKYLVDVLGEEYSTSPIKDKDGCFELTIGGNLKSNRVIRHLYYDCCMALTRKLIKAIEANHATFEFHRLKDISGVSGTGIVAEGKCFRNGKVALAWCASEISSVVIYDSLDEMFSIHSHEENNYIKWLDN